MPVTWSPLSPPGNGGWGALGPGVRDPEEEARARWRGGRGGVESARDGKERRGSGGARLGPRLPDSQPPGPGRGERSEGRGQGEREGIPGDRGRSRHPLLGSRSPKGSEMLPFDVYARGEGGMPRSRLTAGSGLLVPGIPGGKRGGSGDGTGDPRRLSSHPAAARAGVLRERRGKRERRFDERRAGDGNPGDRGPDLGVRAFSPGRGRPGTSGDPEGEMEERETPTPTLGGETASATPSPRRIPSLTATKKRRPRDPGGAPAPNPRGRQGVGAPGARVRAGGPHSTTVRALRPPPQPQGGRGKGSWWGGLDRGRGRQGHSRLERVLNGGGHGPLGWAASGPGRRCRRARAQPGLRRPLCRPARYDFIHSWGCGASGAGRAGGGAQPIPAPPSARRDVESRGARRRPRAPLPGLHVPGGVRRTALPLAAGDTGRGGSPPRASFLPPWECSVSNSGSPPSRHRGRGSRWSLASRCPQGMWMTLGSVVYSCLGLFGCLFYVGQPVNKRRG